MCSHLFNHSTCNILDFSDVDRGPIRSHWDWHWIINDSSHYHWPYHQSAGNAHRLLVGSVGKRSPPPAPPLIWFTILFSSPLNSRSASRSLWRSSRLTSASWIMMGVNEYSVLVRNLMHNNKIPPLLESFAPPTHISTHPHLQLLF